jgi:hypothetical protein
MSEMPHMVSLPASKNICICRNPIFQSIALIVLRGFLHDVTIYEIYSFPKDEERTIRHALSS